MTTEELKSMIGLNNKEAVDKLKKSTELLERIQHALAINQRASQALGSNYETRYLYDCNADAIKDLENYFGLTWCVTAKGIMGTIFLKNLSLILFSYKIELDQ